MLSRKRLGMLILMVTATASAQKPRFTNVTASSGIVVAENTKVGGTNPHAVAIEDVLNLVP